VPQKNLKKVPSRRGRQAAVRRTGRIDIRKQSERQVAKNVWRASTKRRPTRSAPGKDIRVPLSAEATLANIKADLKAWELKQVIKRGKKGK